MLVAYSLSPFGPKPIADGEAAIESGEARWVDLLAPTPAEDKASERFLGASIPSREEAIEIEFSSRFYIEDGAVFMTASIAHGFDSGTPILTPLTFVLAKGRLATVRYAEFSAFRQFLNRATKPESGCGDATGVFLALLEAVVDRIADVVEKVSSDVDTLNIDIFNARAVRRRERRLEEMIGAIGKKGDMVAKARESLASLERLVQFAGAVRGGILSGKEHESRLKLIGRDVKSLADQVGFLSNRIFFLLDATLGLISVSQNEVIRVLTMVATIFFPPTLIGTIYGMNFDFMPETHWAIGYPLVVAVMVASAVLPYLYFKRRGWF